MKPVHQYIEKHVQAYSHNLTWFSWRNTLIWHLVEKDEL